MIRRLYNRRFNTSAIVESTLVQRPNRYLGNRWLDACTIFNSVLVQQSNWRLCDSRINACVTVNSRLVKKIFCFVLETSIVNFFEVLFLIHIDNSANTAKVMVAHHKVSLSIRQLKRVLKKWVYREERQNVQSTMFLRLF